MLQLSETVVFAMASSGQPSGLIQFLPFAMILAIFYFLILLPMKRRQRKVQEFQSSLKVGDNVVYKPSRHVSMRDETDQSEFLLMGQDYILSVIEEE